MDRCSVKEEIDYLMFRLRQQVAVAKEAKAINYGDDLFEYSLKSAEKTLAEIETLIFQYERK